MKKKILALFILIFVVTKGNTQVSKSYETIKQLILNYDSKAKLDDKLILVSFWSANDIENRETNKEMQRVFKIYENAKLLNGLKGVYFSNFCINTDAFNHKLCVKKDSLINNLSFLVTSEDFSSLNTFLELDKNKNKTILFNSKGDLISTEFKKEEVFKLLLNQITR